MQNALLLVTSGCASDGAQWRRSFHQLVTLRAMVAVILVAGACGRIGFPEQVRSEARDASADASDASRPGPILTQLITTNSCSDCTMLTTTVGVAPATAHRALLVAIALGEGIPGASPMTSSVTYTTTPLQLVMRTVHADASFQPVAEHWMLLDPGPGGDLLIELPAQAHTVIMAAMLLIGVDPERPVSSIDAAGFGLVPLFEHNLGNVSTCGNLSGATVPGATSVPVAWTVNSTSSDLWIDIATSFQPPS